MPKKTQGPDKLKPSSNSQTRRSFMKTALSGGAVAASAYLGITRDVLSKQNGPIIIGHQCELTGGFSSWGYWQNKCANTAIKLINEGGGIAGRKVELVVEDTESNTATGARKVRSLIKRRNSSFIIGSVHSGIMLASIPIATQSKVPYFSSGEASEATGSRGSRYSFRSGMDTYSIAAAGAPWAYENLGKNWTMIFPDYAWGHSHYQEHKRLIEAMGGTVNDPIAVPLDAKDLIPYLAKIPKQTEVLFSVFFGALSIAFYTQQKSMRLDEKMNMYSVSGTIEAIDPRTLGGAAEGVYFLENFPRPVEYMDNEYHREFIKILEVDPVYAQEIGSDRIMNKSHCWQAWENLFMLKATIEASGWQTKKDTPGVIEALEGYQAQSSIAHPQGAKIMRSQDHRGIIDSNMSRVEDGKFVLKRKIPKEVLIEKLPVRYNLNKMKL